MKKKRNLLTIISSILGCIAICGFSVFGLLTRSKEKVQTKAYTVEVLQTNIANEISSVRLSNTCYTIPAVSYTNNANAKTIYTYELVGTDSSTSGSDWRLGIYCTYFYGRASTSYVGGGYYTTVVEFHSDYRLYAFDSFNFYTGAWTIGDSAAPNTSHFNSHLKLVYTVVGNDYIEEFQVAGDIGVDLEQSGSVIIVFESIDFQNILDLYKNTANTYYDSGYNSGYSTGSNLGNSAGYQTGYDAGVLSQQSVIENAYSSGYADGYAEGENQDAAVTSIFSGILQVAMVPINFFLSIFNFEILGINLSAFIRAIFTVVLTIIVIKTVTGKGGGGSDN